MTDGFSSLIDKGSSVGLLEGFKIGRDENHINHLQFSNNTFLFASHDRDKLCNPRLFCVLFQLKSGLKVNNAKITLVGINIEELEVDRVTDL